MSDSVTASDMVREVILAHRADGLALAFAKAGRWLGITPRRARGYWHNEITDPRESESAVIRARYVAWVDQEMRRLDAKRAVLAARREALWGSHGKIHAEVRTVERRAVEVDRRLGTRQG